MLFASLKLTDLTKIENGVTLSWFFVYIIHKVVICGLSMHFLIVLNYLKPYNMFTYVPWKMNYGWLVGFKGLLT